MKKIFALLLALLMLVSAIPFAAATEVADHEHYDNNGNEVCDAPGCSEAVHSKHYDDNGNGVCDYPGCKEAVASSKPAEHEHYDNNLNGVCDYPGCKEAVSLDPIGPGADDDDDDDTGIMGHTHSYTGSYKYNSSYHWKQCWCGKAGTKSAHTLDRYGECTKCNYRKNSWNDCDGNYRVTLKESGKGDTRLSTRYADYGDYVYIYVDPDNGYKVDDIDVYATSTSYKNYKNYNNYMDCDYIQYSKYYSCSNNHYNCDCYKYGYSYSKDINVLKRSSTCYYFRMPASNVTVDVTYTGGSYKYNDNDAYGDYNDVSSNDWFYSAVNYVTKYEIMPGTSYTKFSPNVNADRATIALALYNISGAKASGRENFSDVDSDDWFYDAVVWCSSKGIIEGWNGKFDPYGEVTREDFAVMMHRYAEYKRYSTKASEDLDDYSDAEKVSNYAVEAMEWAVAEGLINGMGNGTLAPQGTTTRAQAAAVLMRFCKNVK